MRDDTLVTDQAVREGAGGGQVRMAGWGVAGYTGLKPLGSGGFGDVVLARHDEGDGIIHLTVRVAPERADQVRRRFGIAA